MPFSAAPGLTALCAAGPACLIVEAAIIESRKTGRVPKGQSEQDKKERLALYSLAGTNQFFASAVRTELEKLVRREHLVTMCVDRSGIAFPWAIRIRPELPKSYCEIGKFRLNESWNETCEWREATRLNKYLTKYDLIPLLAAATGNIAFFLCSCRTDDSNSLRVIGFDKGKKEKEEEEKEEEEKEEEEEEIDDAYEPLPSGVFPISMYALRGRCYVVTSSGSVFVFGSSEYRASFGVTEDDEEDFE